MNPFFSIVIPTYNRAYILPKAIESVIKQTFENWELVIIDDGSTDNTQAIVESYNDLRIKYLKQENKERSASRNNGIRHSSGTNICFLDSDDYFLPERLQTFYNELSLRNFPKAVFYTSICFDKDGVIEKREENPNIFGNMLEYVVYNVIGNPQVCIHKSILDTFTFDESLNISEDMELWVRIIAAGNDMIYLDYANVIAGENQFRSISYESGNSARRMLKVLRLIFSKNHPGNKISKLLKNYIISSNYYNQSKYFIYHNNKRNAILMLIYSIFTQLNNHQNKHKLLLIFKLIKVRKNKCNTLLDLTGG